MGTTINRMQSYVILAAIIFALALFGAIEGIVWLNERKPRGPVL